MKETRSTSGRKVAPYQTKSTLQPIQEEKHNANKQESEQVEKSMKKESGSIPDGVTLGNLSQSEFDHIFRNGNIKRSGYVIEASLIIPGQKCPINDKIRFKFPKEQDLIKQKATGLQNKMDLTNKVIGFKTEYIRDKLTKKLLRSRKEENWKDANKKILQTKEEMETEIRKNFMEKIQNMQYMGDLATLQAGTGVKSGLATSEAESKTDLGTASGQGEEDQPINEKKSDKKINKS